jgi:hypothetical protein
MKRLIVISLFSVLLSIAAIKPVMAEEAKTCVQVTQYGGAVGIVCGAKHEPVETGLADINPLVLSSIFLSLAGYGQYSYKKLLRKEVAL